MALTRGVQVGPYQIVSALGAGGMGEVYRARDTKLGREVAIKVLPAGFAHDADRLARFEREAHVLASLNHPNIAVIHGVEEFHGVPALVMELVEGPTLADRIVDGPIPLQEALPIARQIAEALEAAHEQGIIHRDLKPANVKVKPDGTVKVLDFGLAKTLESERPGTDLSNSPTLTARATGTGVILGTAGYMSPEQARGSAVDRRADVWAFGVVLFEMASGRPPFAADTVTDTIAAIVTREPSWNALPAATPLAVRRLLVRCLKKDPKMRLRDIGDARLEIEEAMSHPDDGAEHAVTTVGDAPPVWRRGLPWGVAAVLAAATVLFGTLLIRQRPEDARVIKLALPPPEKASFGSIAVSPDGRWLAFTAATGGKDQLWLRALDSITTSVLPGTEGAAFPFWSPESRFIGFFAAGKLKKIAVSGGPVQTLCDAGGRIGAALGAATE
jgi:eukaryotic-like serine/threonine-protein kinase